MQTVTPQLQTLPVNQPTQAATADLSDFDRLMAGNHVPAIKAPQIDANAQQPAKRWVKLAEIKGEIEVECELDYTINACAICGKADCSCTPRSIIPVKQRISYPMETVVATVVALQ